ncbi:hypothetical protein BDF19DRAFT_433389 [Syncephalis fuscata]|nr:hypothetical protein BDF19DRAFT_433389 [Syncephalis fuscata]
MVPKKSTRQKGGLVRKRPRNSEVATSSPAKAAEESAVNGATESSYRTLFRMLKKARKSKRPVVVNDEKTTLNKEKEVEPVEEEALSGEESSDNEDHLEETFDNDDGLNDLPNGHEEESAYERYFGENLSEKLNNERVAQVDEKKWQCLTGNDKIFGQMAYYALDTPSDDKDTPTFDQAISFIRESSNNVRNNAFGVKQRLIEAWGKYSHKSDKTTPKNDQPTKLILNPLQARLMGVMRNYRDILYTSRDSSNADSIRDVYALHLLDHIYQTRDQLRDQGFTRPKVLVVLPTRSAAVRLVEALIRLSGCDSVHQLKRFQQEYGTMKDLEIPTDDTKPIDYLNYFTGNADDHFRLGIRFTRKTMKLCSEFYASDLIIASPLGLRTIIGARGEKKRDFDFLSSIEVLIVDQAHSYLMQNWDHVEHLLKHMNMIPQESRDCDFSRVKNWYLDGRAKYLRQTLIFSEYLAPELNSMFSKYCCNVAGKLKVRRTNESGTINDVTLPIQQIFTRIDCTSLAKAADLRFEHFKDKVFPALQQSAVQQSRTMIFIPSYYDYVRIRNYLEDQEINFILESSDISRSRTAFFHGDCDFMLYTERVHFYRRYRIRGAQHIFFYQLPENAQFYPELLGVLSDAVDGLRDLTISALYSRYDQLRLERVVGTQRAQRMIQGEKPAYLFA